MGALLDNRFFEREREKKGIILLFFIFFADEYFESQDSAERERGKHAVFAPLTSPGVSYARKIV